MSAFEGGTVWAGARNAEFTKTALDDWLMSDPMRRLTRGFGFDSWLAPDWRQRLSWFTSATWDFRRSGQERDLVASVALVKERSDLVLDSARHLGLMSAVPPRRQTYDVILILGGLVRACLTRPEYAMELLTGGLEAAGVVALGAFRTFSPAEQTIARALGLNAADEYKGMLEGMARSFGRPRDWIVDGPGGSGDRSFSSWCVSRWSEPRPDHTSDLSLAVVAAPSGEPSKRRAHSAETYDFWATKVRKAGERSVLLVTNPIYVPYQGAAAVGRLGLRHDLEVETVGISEAAADLGEWTQTWEPQEYLQEIGSAVRGFVQLREAIA